VASSRGGVGLRATQLNISKESEAMATNDNRKVEQWDLDRLRPHPKQGQYFADPPPHEVAELAADMDANGQLQPVEVLPDGTIIAGHKRLAAARLLGWTKINVWVRYDLAADPAAAERRLIEDNLNRRQLTPLELAACYRRLKEMAQYDPGGPLLDYERGELRDRIGKRLGKSGRTLDRYLRALDTPQEVRAAVAADKLAVTVAEQVAGLGEEQQAEIAKQLRAGGEPREVVRRHLGAAPRRVRNATDLKDKLVKGLQRAAADLDGRVEEVRWVTDAEEQALREGERLIGLLLERGRAVRAAEDAEDDLWATDEVDPADEADGGPADASRPDNLAGGRGRRPSRDGNGEESNNPSTPGGGQPADGPAPGKAAGRRTARKPGRPADSSAPDNMAGRNGEQSKNSVTPGAGRPAARRRGRRTAAAPQGSPVGRARRAPRRGGPGRDSTSDDNHRRRPGGGPQPGRAARARRGEAAAGHRADLHRHPLRAEWPAGLPPAEPASAALPTRPQR
jgi:ParB family chromosome partitioning protein